MCAKDRPALENREIEVTPEMIEVGYETLMCYPLVEPDEEHMRWAVEAVYKAMHEARGKECAGV